jgi:hypothetical protein
MKVIGDSECLELQTASLGVSVDGLFRRRYTPEQE